MKKRSNHNDSHDEPNTHTNDTNATLVRPRENTMTVQKLAGQRFAAVTNPYAYTRSIKVAINNTNIGDLNLFNDEFKSQFEKSIGKGIVKNVTTTKYMIESNSINNIEAIVELCVPLNYQDINGFRFPMNWTFYEFRSTQYDTKFNTHREWNFFGFNKRNNQSKQEYTAVMRRK